MTPKEGHVPRPTMARPKPFVVTSVVTKRYTPTTRKAPLQKLPLRIPPPRSGKERPLVPRWVPTNQISRPGSSPAVVPNVGPRRSSSKPIPMSAPNKTRRVQKASPLHMVPTRGRSLPEKTSVPKPLKMVQGVQGGKLVGGRPTSVLARSTQVTTANELPPRPSCAPRAVLQRSSVSVVPASKGKQDVTVKVSTARPRNPSVRQKPFVIIGAAMPTGRVKVKQTFVKESVVAGGCRSRTPTRDGRLTLRRPATYLHHAVEPPFHVAWSPPGSPDLSSFPSQSWTIVVSVDVNKIKTPTEICCDETFNSVYDAAKLDSAGQRKDSCERSESISCSPASSSSATVVQTPESQAEPRIGSDGTVQLSTPIKASSREVLRTVCAATMISPSRPGTASSMATLAKVMDRRQASSSAQVSVVRRVAEMVRTFFSPSWRTTSRLSAGTASSKTMGTAASRIRKLFIPPLHKDAKMSRNPTTQLVIEMLRARRMVAGGWMFDPRLPPRLGSLAAMEVITKMGTSSSDNPGLV